LHQGKADGVPCRKPFQKLPGPAQSARVDHVVGLQVDRNQLAFVFEVVEDAARFFIERRKFRFPMQIKPAFCPVSTLRTELTVPAFANVLRAETDHPDCRRSAIMT
jgi:hypothetical protein